MANTFGTDILIQAKDPMKAANFYVKELGFEITDKTPKMVGLHGQHINLFIERGVALGPVLEVTAKNIEVTDDLLDIPGRIAINEPRIETGMVVLAIIVDDTVPRNAEMTSTTKMIVTTRVLLTSAMESRTMVALSATFPRETPGGIDERRD